MRVGPISSSGVSATRWLVRSGRAPHPDGTEVDPSAWVAALEHAVADAGGLADVGAVAVGGQQHGMVLLDDHGEVVRPALLWNDTRSAQAAADLTDPELAGDLVEGHAVRVAVTDAADRVAGLCLAAAEAGA